MLKRQQVLIPDFVIDYLKWVNKEYNFPYSYSATIRVLLMSTIGMMITMRFKDIKYKYNYKYITSLFYKNGQKIKMTKKEGKALLEDVEFETKRVINLRMKHKG